MGWGRKTSNFCDKCAEAFPELVDGACSHGPLHELVKRRLADYPMCQACFDTYQRTAELCRQTVKEAPHAMVDRLLARLRALRDE